MGRLYIGFAPELRVLPEDVVDALAHDQRKGARPNLGLLALAIELQYVDALVE